jgi:DNA-binding CsgD family transcriptional regulator/PAS domain-containing protein
MGGPDLHCRGEMDGERFASAVEKIYGAAPDPSQWPDALQAVGDYFGDAGAVLIYGRDDGQCAMIACPTLAPFAPAYLQDWWHRDIRGGRARKRGYFLSRDVITDRDVVTPEEMETHPFYADFLAGLDLKYFAGAMVSPDRRVEVTLGVQRRPDRGPFSDAEHELVARFGVHVEKSLRLSIRLMDAELTNLGLGAAFARLGIGIFVLDSLGRITLSNPAAQSFLGDGLDIVEERLRARPSPQRADPGAALREAIQGYGGRWDTEPKAILVDRLLSTRPLALYVLPIAAPAAAADQILTNARAIVLVIDPDSGGPPEPSLIRDVMGLTLSEARLASLVGSGLAPRDAAVKLGIAEETARSVLKRVFDKVGVSRQSELAALMTRMMLK